MLHHFRNRITQVDACLQARTDQHGQSVFLQVNSDFYVAVYISAVVVRHYLPNVDAVTTRDWSPQICLQSEVQTFQKCFQVDHFTFVVLYVEIYKWRHEPCSRLFCIKWCCQSLIIALPKRKSYKVWIYSRIRCKNGKGFCCYTH